VQPPYLIMDGRRMIPDYRDLVKKGYGYIAVGGGYLPGAKTEAEPAHEAVSAN
jgi:UDPglucose 6-dehydrogenase